MCGICGILQHDGDRAAHARRVDRMSRALAHRGPDDAGSYDDRDVALGFRRLAVIDLETGQQPIRLEDDRAVIVLNGEIYNYRELRRELAPRHEFRSRGDVEVVLRLYAEQGIEGLRRLDGMFALAIWDRARRTLYLARDRFGVKPLFFCRQQGAIAFASEVAALLEGGFPADPRIDRVELRHYLAQKYVSPEGSLFRDVRSLAPASVLEISPCGERTYRFWEPPPPVDESSDADAAERLGVLLQAAVRRQLVADVPVGVFLSGGVDSGLLTALVRRAEAGSVRTFSIGFDSREVANELPQARGLARHLGTEHHELTLDPHHVASDLPAIFAALDGPLGDPTVVPTWYMSRFARRTVTVALSGEGADEIFGGYDRQRFDTWIDRIGPVGRRLAPGALALAGRRPSARMLDRLRMSAGLARQLDWSRVFTAEQVDEIAEDSVADEAEVAELHATLAKRWLERERQDPVNARLDTDRELFLVGDLLPKVDRMSMAHSLEVRVPYLDNELADFMLALPGRMKVRGRQVKWLLRRHAADVLPPETVRRRKQGFDVPTNAWQRGALRELLTDYLSEATLTSRGLFRPAAVSRMVSEHLQQRADHGERLWALMALEGWMRAALDRRAVATTE